MNKKNIEIMLTGLRRRLNNEPISLVELFYKGAKDEQKEAMKTYSKTRIDAAKERTEAYKIYLKERKNK